MPKFNTKNVTEPKDGLVLYKNRYWLCMDGDPEKALFYGTTAQCNSNIKVLEWSLKQQQYADLGNLQIVHIDMAFVPERN